MSAEPISGYWQPGTEITWRWLSWFEKPAWSGISWAEPLRVLRDDEFGLVAWLPVGAPVLKIRRPDGTSLREDKPTMFTTERIQTRETWERSSALRIVEPGGNWSTWCFFDGITGEFQGWYVNLESPHTREGAITYTRDLVLDVVVDRDGNYSRKDEDELELAVQAGLFTVEEGEVITALADRAEAAIRAWGSPFCDGWENFKPDPAWPVPQLPPEL